MSTIVCFLLEPTDRAREFLRRYASGPCAAHGEGGYHNVELEVGVVAYDPHSVCGDDHDHSDPRWPAACSCGYAFKQGDFWQHGVSQLYRRTDTGALHTLRDAPVGAMWYAPWYLPTYVGPDGNCLVVKTPGGDWIIDSVARDGGRWTRTGEPPNVTASPSIGFYERDHVTFRYHGWLRNGRLEDA